MTKKATAFIFISALFAAAVLFGFSAARYESSVTVTDSINYARTLGAISVYEPTSVTSYPADVSCYDEDGNCFRIGANKPGCDNIRFAVTNKVTKDGKDYFNEVNTDYYIRIIDPDNPDAASPVEYKAYEENADFTDISKSYTRDEQTGYYYAAAFNLPATETERVFRFSMQVTWAGNKTLGLHKTAVQMIRKRADGSYAVIAETELNFRFDVTVDYFVVDNLSTVYESRLLPLAVGDTIDFTNADMIPAGYKLQYATSFALGWAGVDKIVVNNDYAAYVIQVRLIKDGYIAVTLNYRDRGKPTTVTNADGSKYRVFETISTQVVWKIQSAASTVDFSDADSRQSFGVTLPDGYEYIAAHCDYKDWVVGDGKENYFNDAFAIPQNTSVDEMLIDVYVAKKQQPLKVKTMVVRDSGGTEELINEKELEFGEDGKLTFTPAELRALCGKRPDGYDYSSIQVFVRVIKGDWIGNTMSIGNMWVDVNQPLVDVQADYYKIYQGAEELTSATGYCLANPNTVLLIKAWW